jgi:hypothetical protein
VPIFVKQSSALHISYRYFPLLFKIDKPARAEEGKFPELRWAIIVVPTLIAESLSSCHRAVYYKQLARKFFCLTMHV